MNEPYTPPVAKLMSGEIKHRKQSIGIRFLSLVMIIGAIASIVAIVLMTNKIIAQPLLLVIFIPFLILFVIYILKGVSLWRGNPKAYKWAFWLFVIQIPIINIPYFSYQLYTGILIAFQYGNVANNTVINFGGAFNFYISNAIKATYFGVNIFALIAALYIWRSRPGRAETAVESDPALNS